MGRHRKPKGGGSFDTVGSRSLMLFSFTPKPGREYMDTDDSEDSDYCPGEDETGDWDSDDWTPNPGNSRRGKNKPTERDLLSVPCNNGHKLWAEGLPNEMLVKIFSVVVSIEGPLPFLCRAAHVCRSWRLAAIDSSLWREIDLSFGTRLDCPRINKVPSTLRWLIDNRLKGVRKLNLTFWQELKFTDFEHLFKLCQNLQSLNISRTKITPAVIRCLSSSTPSLSCLDLSWSPDAVMAAKFMCPMLEKIGARLEDLNLTGNKIKGFQLISSALMNNCPNLTVLDLSCCRYVTSQLPLLSIERLQACCPRLKVLRLENTKLPLAPPDANWRQMPGFVDLEELTLAVTDVKTYDMIASVFAYNNDFITRVLKSSTKLVNLDVNMCVDVTFQSLVQIPATSLRHLRIARSSTGGRYRELPSIVDKWKHSFQSLDVSWNRYARDMYDNSDLDVALMKLANHKSPVHAISLAGTSVSVAAVRSLIHDCTSLSTLDLSSCRGLPRGVKHKYETKDQIAVLAQVLVSNSQAVT